MTTTPQVDSQRNRLNAGEPVALYRIAAEAVCEARNVWSRDHEERWLETDENHPDDFIGRAVVDAILAHPQPNAGVVTDDPVLAKDCRVGHGIIRAGCKVSLLIGCAERAQEYHLKYGDFTAAHMLSVVITQNQLNEACHAYYELEKEWAGARAAKGCIREAMRAALQAASNAAFLSAAPKPECTIVHSEDPSAPAYLALGAVKVTRERCG